MKTLAFTIAAGCAIVAAPALAAPSNLPPPTGAIYSLTGQAISTSYVKYTTSFTASLASTALTFAFRDDPGYLKLDDVSLTTGAGPNVIVNGGFESGPVGSATPSGWTYLNQYGATFGGVVATTATSTAHAGSNFYDDGAVQAYDAITQQVATTIGAVYTLSFWVAQLDSNTRTITTYQPLSTNGDVTGTTGNGIDLFVYAASAPPPPSAVPEPATWAMMIGGFGAIGAALRRHRRLHVHFA